MKIFEDYYTIFQLFRYCYEQTKDNKKFFEDLSKDS